MAQIFTASADTRLRAFLLAAAILIFLLILFVGGYASSSYGTLIGWVQDQPVPFSHEHHVAGLGIDCRYCHTSVETSAYAGLPATHICMSCHSQIWTGAPMLAAVRHSLAANVPLRWNRVSRLPDYVYFNHSIHVTRGVPCVTCHGRVDQMPLMSRARPFQMQWCLNCHRDPAPNLRPPDQVTRMDWSDWDAHPEQHKDFGALVVKAYGIEPAKLTQCNICHR
ncbi:cytochrome c3 family protein [Rhizobium sp. BR 362]|uniref:cytochrome c3 family protein n=1 Tax=Rhizobium sp. BR 362 TaxID=3040670 RepID=UPI002F40E8A6